MAKKLIDILSAAAVVRDETNEKANTAERVGGVLVELANYLSAFAPVSNVTVEADGANVRLVLHLKNEDGTVSTRSVTLPGATTANAGVLTPELLKALQAADRSETAARQAADAELLKRIIGKSTASNAYIDPFKYLDDYQSEKDASGTITKHAIRVMQDDLLDTLRHSDYRDSFPYIGHMRAHVEGVPIEMWTYVKAWNTGSTNGVFVQVVRTNFGLKNGVISSALTESFHEYFRTVTVGMANGSVTDVTATAWQESTVTEELYSTTEENKNKISDLESGVIYDVSSHNNGAVFESLSSLLSSSNLSTLIPTSVRHGGMSIRFIQGSEQSSDNKYVQYRLMDTAWSNNTADWQGVDNVPTRDSDNLVKSGVMFKELNEITENIVAPIKTEKSYILANGDIGTLYAYGIYSIHVNAGEQYHIIGTSLAGNGKRYAIYSSETPSSESCLMVAAESVVGDYNVLLEIPKNAVLLVATFMSNNEASVVIKQQVAKNKIDFAVNSVAKINQSIYYEAGENVDASIQSGKYIISTGAIGSLGAYSLKVIQVEQGEKYRIVGNGMKGSASVYGVYKNETMDATTMLIVGNVVGSYGESYDVIVTIPYGGTTLAVTYMSNVPTSAVVTKIVEKSKIEDITTLNAHMDVSSMYCYIKNQQLILNYRCHGKIIQLTLKPTGGNNLFDFSSFAYKISDNAVLSDLESGFSIVAAGGTDWHAPFIVKAVNNVDGDNISDGVYRVYFTGGNHQYNNSGGGSTSTARLVSLAFFVDGKRVSDFKGYCTNIRIEWVNNVQGYNTTKANGTGREILQERHIMELGRGEIKERIVLTPLEDIKISLWYGVQAFAQSVNSIEFIGSDNRFTTNSSNINSISKKCRRMQLNRDNISVGIEIDESLDLGTRDKVTANNNNFGAFRSGSGDKYYCQIIKASVGDTYPANGNYYLNCKWFFD